MQQGALFYLLGILCSVALSLDASPRLIQFNETYSVWMLPADVDALAQECGAEATHGGFFDITDHRDLSPKGLKVLVPNAFPADPTHQVLVNSLLPALDKKNLETNNNHLSSYHTRYYTTQTGADSANWIKAQFEKYKKEGRNDVSISTFPHTWLQPSVIARITGTTKPDEIVIIGAHEDSINGGATNKSPGADDDASGTVTVLEIFRVLVNSGWKPQRTVEFHTYSAEEVGLRGSQAIAESYQKAGKKVYAMMQLDMTFYTASSKVPKVGIITDYTDPALSTFVRRLVETYTKLGWADSVCGYGCSDHASWTKAGYAAAFPFEAPFPERNPKIHSTSDTLSILSLDHGLEFGKLGLGFLVELGGVSN
eukprot:TRINITY_DN216_c0_g1_i1.p1 TRINITY_DN216_c0_g1~~TRINITY_DN216_c0_g1_i1.p1  ORF type:complete len:368 (-),score=72.80 TRINITY_DN216_c0_g1_i1:69-1172(-)